MKYANRKKRLMYKRVLATLMLCHASTPLLSYWLMMKTIDIRTQNLFLFMKFYIDAVSGLRHDLYDDTMSV